MRVLRLVLDQSEVRLPRVFLKRHLERTLVLRLVQLAVQPEHCKSISNLQDLFDCAEAASE